MDDLLVSREDLRHLYDIAIGSMDFSSGFLNHEDVLVLRKFAILIGASIREATPTNFRASFAHEFENPSETYLYDWNKYSTTYNKDDYLLTKKTFIICGYCRRLESNPVHHGVSVTESTKEYEVYSDV